jgi:cell division ATPase FtsA
MQIPFLSKLGRGKLVAVFDVGSGSVGAAIAELRDNKPVLIHNSLRLFVPFEDRSVQQLATIISQKVQEAGTKLLEMHASSSISNKNIHDCLVVIHTPWIRSITSSVKASLKESSEIVEDMIFQLSQKSLNSENILNEDNIFERNITRVELNGYPTSSPIGKVADHVGVVTLSSEVDNNLLRQIENSVFNIYPGINIQFRSSTLVDSTLMRRTFAKSSFFTVVDITSEGSSITVLRDGIIKDFETIPIGYRTILRSIAEERNAPVEDVQSRIKMLAQDACSTDECKSLEDALDNASSVFTSKFGEVFGEIAKVNRLPNALVIRSHPDLSKWFVNFFARLDFAQFTETTQPFVVGTILLGATSEYLIFMPGNIPDSGIATSSSFLYTFQNDTVGNFII